MDKLFSKQKIVFYAFIINVIAFVFVPSLLSKDKGEFFNILPELPELLVDYFWTILLAVDSKVIAYSPLADIIFQIPNGLTKSLSIILFLGLFIGSFLLFIKILLQQKLITTKQLYLYIPFVVFSYGFLFEFFWGQWNFISFVLIMYSIFVVYKKNRFFSYLLFAFAASLKVYPFIFILLYIGNKKEIKRWIFDILYATMLFIASFFVQGYEVLLNYLTQLTKYSSNPVVWYANMSIYSFNSNFKDVFGFNLGIIPYIIAAFCLIIIILSQIKSKIQLNGILLYALIIIALLFPSVSMDYKLSLLIVCYPILYNTEFHKTSLINRGFLFVSSILIFSTLFSYKFYELILRNWFFTNKFTAISLLLVVMTIYTVFCKFDYTQKKNK